MGNRKVRYRINVCLQALEGHGSRVNSVTFFPDGNSGWCVDTVGRRKQGATAGDSGQLEITKIANDDLSPPATPPTSIVYS